MKYLNLIIVSILLLSCGDDNTEEQRFKCCGDNPFASGNVNKLDNKEKYFPNAFSPNNDGNNDSLIIPLLSNYKNNFTMTVSDLSDTIVFETSELAVFFDGKDKNGKELPYGTYKFKLVIDNEDTFLYQSYICLARNRSETKGYDFSNCLLPQTPVKADPVFTE